MSAENKSYETLRKLIYYNKIKSTWALKNMKVIFG